MIGVLAEGFDLPREVMPTLGGALHSEVVVPLELEADAAAVRNREDYNIVGKLKPGVVARRGAGGDGPDHGRPAPRPSRPSIRRTAGSRFDVVPLHEQVVGNVRQALLVLTAAVALVLLIAGVNVANLLLARATARQKEVAVRAALGASRARLVREQLAESLLLALGGGAVGLLLCRASVPGAACASGPRASRASTRSTSAPSVLLFTLVVSLASGLVFGLAPAWRLSRPDLQSTLTRGPPRLVRGRRPLLPPRRAAARCWWAARSRSRSCCSSPRACWSAASRACSRCRPASTRETC